MKKMQEQSWWTWHRTDGSRYEAPAGLWMRVADRSWEKAHQDFGPLANFEWYAGDSFVGDAHAGRNDGPALRDWQALHNHLKAMARLWQPDPDNPAVYRLTPFNPLQHAEATSVRHMLEMAAEEKEIVPRLDGWHLRDVPKTLRGYLLMDCCADVAAQTRFRRCANCNEWFPVTRSDTKHCSNACKQALYRKERV